MRSGASNISTSVVWALAACLLASCASPRHDESWLILERTSTQHPEIVSVMRNLPNAETRTRFPILFEVAWGYKSLPNGLPTEDELVIARTLYDGLDRIVGPNGVHAMTRTGDGGRTMYYYIADVALVSEAIRTFFDAQPPMSVKVVARQDPGWERVREVIDGIPR